MIEEWSKYNTDHSKANRSPSAIFKGDVHNFTDYMEKIDVKEPKEGRVPSTVFFCLDKEKDLIVGALSIRHYLNDALLKTGGHIGDGIRPSQRNKGYGKAMINKALGECKRLGIDRVLMVCDKDNVASAKTIIANGCILENEIEVDGKIVSRYWIDLKDSGC